MNIEQMEEYNRNHENRMKTIDKEFSKIADKNDPLTTMKNLLELTRHVNEESLRNINNIYK